MDEDQLYAGREQTLIKHFILRQYLSKFAHIIGFTWDSLTYVDCFSGPWNVRSEDLADSSFAIALDELRKARNTHRRRGREIALRCFFLEKDPVAYSRLRAFAEAVQDATVETKNAVLEDAVSSIVDFIQRGGKETFPFVFIDPTGWSGFAMDTIAALLQLNPGEVLINFMSGHIRRFLDSPQLETQRSFERLFGSVGVREKVQGLAREDRDDLAVAEYSASVKRTGGFRYVCSAIVLHPEQDRTHFHLIYATRHRKGVEAFKEAERMAMTLQESTRATARGRRRVTETGQPSFLSDEELHSPAYYEALRHRYLGKSMQLVVSLLKARRDVAYDDAWDIALSQPMT